MTVTDISSKPPESYADINDEITRQQNLLIEINDQVLTMRTQGLDTKKKEEEMWDVQQGITILKRKVCFITHYLP